MTDPIRTFIVDDSPLARAVLRQMLQHDPDIEWVGEASGGKDALRRIPPALPDVIIMDMVMPGMDGLETTRELMASFPRPILLVSDLVGHDAALNFKALQSGALDLMRKPSAAERGDPDAVREFVRKVRVLSGVPVVTRYLRRGERRVEPTAPPRSSRPPGRARVVLIGASTGGPVAVHRVLSTLGGRIDCPILLVQHMTPGFTAGMVRWLAEALEAPVELARNGAEPLAGSIYVAPEGFHLVLRGNRMCRGDDVPTSGHCPSVNALFNSAAATGMAGDMVAVLLTGMGDDGARGMLALREAGAWTIAQDQETSVVYGMPGAAASLGGASEQLPLASIAPRLLEICGRFARSA